MQNNYEEKYLKYKKKYLDLKKSNKSEGGGIEYLYNAARRSIACDSIDLNKNEIKSNTMKILDILTGSIDKITAQHISKDVDPEGRKEDISNAFLNLLYNSDSFAKVLTTNQETSQSNQSKTGLTRLIKIFKSIKASAVQNMSVINWNVFIAENAYTIMKFYVYTEAFGYTSNKFKKSCDEFKVIFPEDIIQEIIDYLYKILDQVDCYCKNDMSICKITYEEYKLSKV
jgi:hypothetical protein